MKLQGFPLIELCVAVVARVRLSATARTSAVVNMTLKPLDLSKAKVQTKQYKRKKIFYYAIVNVICIKSVCLL